ncbi:efflux RND transporter permease subunit [Candidatus Margulisiibacteriota bacterium]
MNIIKYFIKHKLLVNIIMLSVLIGGIFALSVLRRDSFPDIDQKQIVITTRYPGASVEDVELHVTNPLEENLSSVEGIRSYTSISYENVSSITVDLDDTLKGKELDEVKTDIQRAADQVTDLPAAVTERPLISEVKSSERPIIEVAVTHPDEALLRKAALLLEDKLNQQPLISKTAKIGFRDKEVQIHVNPHTLLKTETALTELISGLKNRSVYQSGGTLESFSNEQGIVTITEFHNTADVENAIIRASYGGKPLLARHVSKVKETYAKPSVLVRSNGKPGISISIVKKRSADVVRTIKKIEELIATIKPSLPEGTEVELINDTSVNTRRRIGVVLNNAVGGMLLVLIALNLFLDLRSAFWTAFGIPFAMLLSIILLVPLGITINPVSLGALILVLGMVVDDAIVIAESIRKKREAGLSPAQSALEGTKEVIAPVITAIATTMIAFIPLVFMPGRIGQFTQSIPLIVILVLMASLFESLFLLPAHLSNDKQTAHSKAIQPKKWIISLQGKYRKSLKKLFQIRYGVIIMAIALLIYSIFFFTHNQKVVLIPQTGIDTFYVRLYAPNGTSLSKTADLVRSAENIIAKLPEDELASFSTRIGHDSASAYLTEGKHANWAIITVYLTAPSERKRSAYELMRQVKQAIMKVQGKDFERVLISPKKRGPIKKGLEFYLVGGTEKQRGKATSTIKQWMQQHEFKNIDTSLKTGRQDLRIDFDYFKLAALGLTVQDVAATLRAAYDGALITTVRQDGEDVEYKVLLAPEYRRDTSYLLSLPVRNQYGRLIRLSKFARLKKAVSMQDVVHYNGHSAVAISAGLDPEKTTATEAANKIKSYYAQTLQGQFPALRIIMGGESADTVNAFQSLRIALLLALIGIYFLLALQFNSLGQPILVMLAIPFAFISIVWIFHLHGAPLSFPAFLGAVGLAGVVVNDSLLLINTFNKKISSDDDNVIAQLVESASLRLRPILLTTITTVAALIPTIYGIGGTDAFLRPLAMSLGYGLLFGTLVTLYLIPLFTHVNHDVVTVFKRWRK